MKNISKLIIFCAVFAFAAPVFAQSAGAELSFYKQESQRTDKAHLQAIADALGAWLDKNYALPTADDAMFLKGDIESRIKNYPAAVVTLLRHKHEFPASSHKDVVVSLLNAAAQAADKNTREELNKITSKRVLPNTPVETRLADFLSTATKLNYKGSFAPLLAEYQRFFARFPGYEGKDRLELMLGDLYRQEKNFQAAIMQYRKVQDIYPSQKYKAAAIRMMGDVYGSELKDFTQAMYYYEMVLKNFPGSLEIGTTYKHMAIMAENKKDYALAVSSAEKAAETFLKDNKTNDAFDAFIYKAQLEETRLKNYTAAADTLGKTATIFAKDCKKFVEAKLKQAAVYGRRLKDPYGELSAYEAIILSCPQAKETPQALFDAAALSEKTKNPLKARSLYNRLVLAYPADPLANKAQKRITAIDKQLAKEGTAIPPTAVEAPAAVTPPAPPPTPSAPQRPADDDIDEMDLVIE